ncbi:BA5345 family protein [Leptospira ainazelensis]
MNSRNDSLTDLMHGNGSSLISLILAGITSCFYIAYCYLEFNVLATEFYNKYTLVFFFLFFVLLFLHSKSYKFTTENLNKFVQDALFHSLSLKKKNDLPVKFYLGNF